MNKLDTGIIISFAYPEEFVAMVPAWYKKPLEWMGVGSDNQMCVGHSAMALIHRPSGDIYYADFGRYITGFGMGRTRTRETDPEVRFDIQATFDENGYVSNEKEILQYVDKFPEKTHGAGPLYASFAYKVNFEKCYAFIQEMNKKGSYPYDPFGKGKTNCSRFVFDAIQKGLTDKRLIQKHKRGNVLTPSPLGNVFYSIGHKRIYRAENGIVELFEHKRKFLFILNHFFRVPQISLTDAQPGMKPGKGYQWLGGIGDGSWFKLEQTPDGMFLSRKTAKGEEIFTQKMALGNEGFNPGREFKLVYDCNASWTTVEQDGNQYRLEAVSDT